MASLFERMKKAAKNEYASALSKSALAKDRDMIDTGVPAINIALSGSLTGGFQSGITVFCGESRTFKSLASLVCAKAYLDKYEDSCLIFFDSELGSSTDYFESIGIDTDRVLHMPIGDVEELKFQITSQLEEIKRGDHAIIVIDSIGNLASKKEVQDAIDEKSVADMSRAKALKSLCRIITPMLAQKDIPCIMVNHTIKTMDFIPQTVMTGGCLLQDVEIITENGVKTIGSIRVGDKVLSEDGNFHTVEFTWTPDTLEDGHPECLEIEFEDGFVVKCSEGHKFLRDGEWTAAKELHPNDVVASMKMDVSSALRYSKYATAEEKATTKTSMKVKSINLIGKHDVYDICVEDTHSYVLANGVVTHNSGILYSADTVINITRSQEKEGKELVGYNFTLNVMKSRHSREKSQIPLTVTFENGINKYSGLLEIAEMAGCVVKPSMGWYSRVNSDGEVEERKWRAKETNTSEFWDSILKSKTFADWIENRYKVASGKLIIDDVDVDQPVESVAVNL